MNCEGCVAHPSLLDTFFLMALGLLGAAHGSVSIVVTKVFLTKGIKIPSATFVELIYVKLSAELSSCTVYCFVPQMEVDVRNPTASSLEPGF